MKITVVIPTYNELENIEKLAALILSQDERIHILFVDDNSPDGTGEIADRLAAANPRVQVLHRAGKMGLGSAYREGFKIALAADSDYIMEMDADFSRSVNAAAFHRQNVQPRCCHRFPLCKRGQRGKLADQAPYTQLLRQCIYKANNRPASFRLHGRLQMF